MAVVASKEMKSYFAALRKGADRCYEVASEAREKGFDPVLEVEIPMADDLASRVEKQLKELKLEGVADIIREISKKHDREETSLLVAKKIAKEFKGPPEQALDTAVRTGLSVLTEGILVAPLDGIASVKIHPSKDGGYVSLHYAGPIRSAGGTGQAMSVLIADVVRRELGIGTYQATEQEIERWKEEIPLYRQAQHLQYQPTDKEIETIVGSCPICIDGEGTESVEISGYRDLPRIETNRVRGGPCLVIAEGLCQKGKKLQKHVRKLDIDGWDFIDMFVKKREKDGQNDIMEPSTKFIKDIVAGRPVYSHPSRKGGFRLRYGRGRTTGLAAINIHPATMHILQETTAVGTQVKLERPGKAGISMPNDNLDGPLLLLKNGNFVRVHTTTEAKKAMAKIEEIIDLGEILIPVGEFLENNHPLVPGVFDIMWYNAELRKAGIEDVDQYSEMGVREAFDLSAEKGVPLHPNHIFFWNDASIEQIDYLRSQMRESGEISKDTLRLPDTDETRDVLVILGAPFNLGDDEILEIQNGLALLLSLGLKHEKNKISGTSKKGKKKGPTLDYVSSLAGCRIGDKCGTRIGARMARPEKADMRKMNPPVHSLFGVGKAGGPQRLLNKAAEAQAGPLMVDLEVRKCRRCGKRSMLVVCGDCGNHTYPLGKHEDQKLDVYSILKSAKKRLGMRELPNVKGVQGMISKNKTVEMPEKGILRAKYGVFVFKDGTCRYDATDAPLTHFRPAEIGTDIDTLKKLGYKTDIHGKPLKNDRQLAELKVQDVILPERGGDYFVQVSKFLDDLLAKIYGMDKFYNAKRREDLVGASIIGLSPHTSGGVLSRLIGFTPASVGFAHPYFHAAKRRNCDGDEDCFMLLLDGLLNFSWSFLPEKRGGRMDAPLLLSTILDPNEIDKEAHNIDLMEQYPIELYEAALAYEDANTIESLLDTVGSRIGTVLQYEGFGFTLDTDDIADAPIVSSYKTLETMKEKTAVQLDLARKIRAVDEKDVAERLINNHLIPDMLGNLKSFSSQTVRCTKCGKKYRRMPVMGHCYCGHKLILTVHEKSVRKYLKMSKDIAEEYDVSDYIKQRIQQAERAMCSLFQNEKVKECTLLDF